MTSEQVTEWLAYDSIEPCGNIEPTHMLALLCSTVVNTVQSIFAKKGSSIKPISPDVFIPKWADVIAKKDLPDEEQSLEMQKQALLAIAGASGARKTRVPKLPPPKRKGVVK